jgi:hypothetical protein
VACDTATSKFLQKTQSTSPRTHCMPSQCEGRLQLRDMPCRLIVSSLPASRWPISGCLISSTRETARVQSPKSSGMPDDEGLFPAPFSLQCLLASTQHQPEESFIEECNVPVRMGERTAIKGDVTSGWLLSQSPLLGCPAFLLRSLHMTRGVSGRRSRGRLR